jgi:hypothetical protein
MSTRGHTAYAALARALQDRIELAQAEQTGRGGPRPLPSQAAPQAHAVLQGLQDWSEVKEDVRAAWEWAALSAVVDAIGGEPPIVEAPEPIDQEPEDDGP